MILHLMVYETGSFVRAASAMGLTIIKLLDATPDVAVTVYEGNKAHLFPSLATGDIAHAGLSASIFDWRIRLRLLQDDAIFSAV